MSDVADRLARARLYFVSDDVGALDHRSRLVAIAELDHPGPWRHDGVQQELGILPVGEGFADEVQERGVEPLVNAAHAK